MLDEYSFKFLICKKIAQLVKLINHLNLQVAERQHELLFETSNFELNLGKTIDSYKEGLEDVAKTTSKMEEELDEEYKTKFSFLYDKLFSDYEKMAVSTQSNMTEFSVSFQHTLNGLQNSVNSIIYKIAELQKDLDLKAENKAKEFQQVMSKMTDQHKYELIALDQESEEKLSLLQEQTSRKLDALDRDFNRSLSNLKLKFGNSDSPRNPNSLSNSDVSNCSQLLTVLTSIKNKIFSSKEEISFLIDTSKAIMKEQISRKDKICQILKDLEISQKSETEESYRIYDGELKVIIDDFERVRKEYEEKINFLRTSFDELQNKYEETKKSNSDEVESQRLFIELSIKKGKESYDTIRSEIDQQIANEQTSFNRHEESYEKLYKQLQNDIENATGSMKKKNEEFTMIKDKHSSEISVLKKSQQNAIEDLKGYQKRKIDELTERNRNAFDNLETKKTIDENRELFNALCFQKTELSNFLLFVDDPEVSDLQKKFNEEKKQVKKKLEEDMEQVAKDETTLIEATSEANRNKLFQTNIKIAENYEETIKGIRESFKVQNFKKEVNSSFKPMLFDLEETLKELSSSANSEGKERENTNLGQFEDIDSLKETKNSEIFRIETEKKMLIEDYSAKQKEEEENHIRKLAEINYYLKKRPENDQIRNEFHSRIQKHELYLKDLRMQFNSFSKQNQAQMSNEKKMLSAFEVEEKESREQLSQLAEESKNSIDKAMKSYEDKKNEIEKKINAFKAKVKKVTAAATRHSRHSSVQIEDANKQTKEETEKLQEKVATAITKLVKHFAKQRERMTIEFGLKIDEYSHSITEQKQINEEYSKSIDPNIEVTNKANVKKVKQKEMDTIQELEMFRAETEKRLSDLDQIIEGMKSNIATLKNDTNSHKSREFELSVIGRLETQLKIKEQQVKDVALDIAEYKKKLVQQEGVYNAHFGVAPAIAVLRPSTAASPIPLNIKIKQQQQQQARPGSANLTMRPMSFLKNRSRKMDNRNFI